MQAGSLQGRKLAEQKAGRAESLRRSEQPFQPNGACGKREKTDRAGMGMEKRREPGDSGKSPGRMMGRAAVVLLAGGQGCGAYSGKIRHRSPCGGVQGSGVR